MKFFHIDWLPQTRWGYRLVSRFHNSSNPALKGRFKRYWPTEQMIAFATKLALIRVVPVSVQSGRCETLRRTGEEERRDSAMPSET